MLLGGQNRIHEYHDSRISRLHPWISRLTRTIYTWRTGSAMTILKRDSREIPSYMPSFYNCCRVANTARAMASQTVNRLSYTRREKDTLSHVHRYPECVLPVPLTCNFALRHLPRCLASKTGWKMAKSASRWRQLYANTKFRVAFASRQKDTVCGFI